MRYLLKIVSRTPPPTSASPSPVTGTSGIVDPQFLIDQATRQTSTVLRVDNVTAKRANDVGLHEGHMTQARACLRSVDLAVAIRGDIRIDALIDLPHAQCALFAYDAATGTSARCAWAPWAIHDPHLEPTRAVRNRRLCPPTYANR